MTVQGILFGFIILNFSTIPSGTFDAISVPKSNIHSSIAYTGESITEWIFYPGSKDGMTVCSSNIWSKSTAFIPGIQLSAANLNNIPSG